MSETEHSTLEDGRIFIRQPERDAAGLPGCVLTTDYVRKLYHQILAEASSKNPPAVPEGYRAIRLED